MNGVFNGCQGCSEGFPKEEAGWKSRGATLPAHGKPSPCALFYSDLHQLQIGYSNCPKERQDVEQNFFNKAI